MQLEIDEIHPWFLKRSYSSAMSADLDADVVVRYVRFINDGGDAAVRAEPLRVMRIATVGESHARLSLGRTRRTLL